MTSREWVAWCVVGVAAVGTPPATLVALVNTIAPIRAVIVTAPEVPAR